MQSPVGIRIQMICDLGLYVGTQDKDGMDGKEHGHHRP